LAENNGINENVFTAAKPFDGKHLHANTKKDKKVLRKIFSLAYFIPKNPSNSEALYNISMW
jgi:hypothetical protein